MKKKEKVERKLEQGKVEIVELPSSRNILLSYIQIEIMHKAERRDPIGVFAREAPSDKID